MPDVVTLCVICNRVSSNVCKMCGKHLCSRHYDARTGLCPTCLHDTANKIPVEKKW